MGVRILVCLVAGLFLLASAVEEGVGVRELADEAPTIANSGASTHVAKDAGGESFGYWQRDANFVGPKYGLPGYKESHNWEEDFDMLSPLVFDHRFYRVLQQTYSIDDAKALSEEELKLDWVKQIESKSAPECPQGNLFFNANTFQNQNKHLTEFSMGGAQCKLILKIYLAKGIFEGLTVATRIGFETDQKFPTLATKLLDPVKQSVGTVGKAWFSPQGGSHFNTPNPGESLADNTFTPARHVTLAFWFMAKGSKEEPQNAELIAYGASSKDMFFRTGWGCLDASINPESKCYFILEFENSEKTTEYFHSFEENNFKPLAAAVGGSKWAHVVMMLSTKNPGGFPKDSDQAGCPHNGGPNAGDCVGTIAVHVNKANLKLVDWTDGTDTVRPLEGWNFGVNKKYWDVVNYWDQGEEVKSRLYVAPCNGDCEAGKPLTCCDVQMSHMRYHFPWWGAYGSTSNVFICDMMAITSGNGGFGNEQRRALALGAIFDSMEDTKKIACFGAENDVAVQPEPSQESGEGGQDANNEGK